MTFSMSMKVLFLMISICLSLSHMGNKISIWRQMIRSTRLQSLHATNIPDQSSQYYSDIRQSIDMYRPSFVNISDVQWKTVHIYCQYLMEWNNKINVISRKDIHNIGTHHIIPSLSMTLICKFTDNQTIIDVGTGGGLPGIPLAIAYPNCQFTLIDSNSKKIQVVQDIINKLDIHNVKAMWTRAENIVDRYDHIVGRAVSAIPNFLTFTSHLLHYNTLNPKSCGLWYLKGGEYNDELQQAGIQTYKKYQINEIIPIESDKSVLFIPRDDIKAFHDKLKMQSKFK